MHARAQVGWQFYLRYFDSPPGPEKALAESLFPWQSRIVSGKRGGLNGSTQHQLEVYVCEFQRLNSFANVDSKKRLSCLSLIEYSLGDGFFLKTIMGPTDYRGVASTV